jgi:hypothetical protein
LLRRLSVPGDGKREKDQKVCEYSSAEMPRDGSRHKKREKGLGEEKISECTSPTDLFLCRFVNLSPSVREGVPGFGFSSTGR